MMYQLEFTKLLTNQRLENTTRNSNGVYVFDRSVIRVGLGAGAVGLLFMGWLGIATIGERTIDLKLLSACLLISSGLIAFLIHVVRLSDRTLQVSDGGISVRDKFKNEIGSIGWVDLGRVTERRKMAQLALWDKAGTPRILVDQQFENFNAIRARILAEYARVFTPKALPIEFSRAGPPLFESCLFALGAAFFGWASWIAHRQHQEAPAIVCLGFSIANVLAFFSLYPQLRGPSVLFEDRIALRGFFNTRVLLKKNITGIELEDISNPRSGTKFSLVVVRASDGGEMKITSKYGSIPEIYLTLRAWLAQH
jgi:hypothetical protein